MPVHDPGCRVGAYLFVMLALGIPCLVAGCGGGDSASKPAPISAVQQKQVQEYMSGYREQMIAEHKGKVKAQAAGKKSP